MTLTTPDIEIAYEPCRRHLFTLVILFLIVCNFDAEAQKKELPVHEDLVQDADKYKVKRKGIGLSSSLKYKAGPYEVQERNAGWTESNRVSKIWSRQVITVTDNKSTFILANGEEAALVNTFFFARSNFKEPLELFSNDFFSFSVGDEETFQEEALFSASILVGVDDKDEWLLTVTSVEDIEQYEETLTLLTNGQRKISLKHINSTLKDGFLENPALGYEFWESDRVLGAVKYFPGTVGYNTIWLGQEVDQKDRLLLSAASIAIIYLKNP